ncbi:MAG: membrane protein insertion efficiency factor YidD [Sulfuricellaceae bacterium]
MSRILVWLIRGYQYFISPYLGPSCRYTPTCSEYASQALTRYGVFKGGWMSTKRLCRCHPWRHGGYDPLP